EFAPEEAVEGLGGFAEFVFGQRRGQLANSAIKLEQDPFLIATQPIGDDFALHFAALHLAETAGVPELVAEIAAQFDILLIKEHVLAQRRAANRAEADRVRPI